MQHNTLVIVPTYNEAHNISRLVRTVMQLDGDMDLLIIDDGSPDGTGAIVKELQQQYEGRLFLLQRSGKLGLGTAYVEGFQYALSEEYTYICEMDADFSHNPQDLPRLITEVQNGETDVAVGSRYKNGISIINWPLNRLILSYGANLYARFITGIPLLDTTAGFKCIHRKVLEKIPLNRISSNGYSFQIELHFRAWKAGFRLKEVSIIFKERQQGNSKMSKKIMREAIWRVWALKFRSLIGKL